MDEIYSLKNDLGMEIVCSSVGAGLVDIYVPDRNGKSENVLVRPKKFYQYYRAEQKFGKPCGRTAGRIYPKEVDLGEEKFTIETDENENIALHGGKYGISEQAFNCVRKQDSNSYYLVCNYLSKDGESGYPGNLKITITYELRKKENRLVIHHEAISDKDTLCNLTCHAYFNLSGNAARKITDEELYLAADKVSVLNDNMIPAALKPVDKCFSFLTPHLIGDYIEEEEVQHIAHGYDHPYLLEKKDPDKVQASLYDKGSGRKLEIRTSYDACVLYTSNWPAGFFLQNDHSLGKYDAVCLEMQYFPNSVNADFIKIKEDILKKGEKYSNFIEYRFLTD